MKTVTHRFAQLLGVIALLLAAVAPAAHGSWPGANGAIVFETYFSGGEGVVRGTGLRLAALGATRFEFTALTEEAVDSDP